MDPQQTGASSGEAAQGWGRGRGADGPRPSAPYRRGRGTLLDGDNGETLVREEKRRLIKAARMYAMCRKAGVAEPMDVTGLAVAAFEEMPLNNAMVFVRANERNVEDLAWALGNSSDAQEFERRLKEIKNLPPGDEPRT